MELPRRTGLRKSRRKSPRREVPDRAPPPPAERLIPLGVVMGTHGVRGELRVKLHNPSSELLFQVRSVQLRAASGMRAYQIASARAGGKGLLLLLAGVDTVERAQALRGAEVCVPRSQLPALPDGEFYHCDLEGLTLVDIAGRTLGAVERVHEYPAANVLRVRTERGVLEVPMREPYLVSIDLTAGQIVVDQIEELDPQPG